IHGAQTLGENIADNGGLRAAHIAYELWVQEHGEEQPVAGLDLDNRQLFFVSYAQIYCSKWTMSGITNFLMRDTHSPGPYRIEGALSNSLAFSDVFKCSNVARFNPSIKCRMVQVLDDGNDENAKSQRTESAGQMDLIFKILVYRALSKRRLPEGDVTFINGWMK
ncbi:NEP-like protein, partial [Mya arenaria]